MNTMHDGNGGTITTTTTTTICLSVCMSVSCYFYYMFLFIYMSILREQCIVMGGSITTVTICLLSASFY